MKTKKKSTLIIKVSNKCNYCYLIITALLMKTSLKLFFVVNFSMQHIRYSMVTSKRKNKKKKSPYKIIIFFFKPSTKMTSAAGS